MAEEMVQDIWIQIWQSRETLTNIRSFQHYLFIITRNHTFDALKKMRRAEIRQRNWERDQSAGHPGELPAQDRERYLSLIDQAIAQLPPQQQKVWILSRRGNRKYQEIADEMNLSRETVKKYLQYATQFIREYVVNHLEIWIFLFLFEK